LSMGECGVLAVSVGGQLDVISGGSGLAVRNVSLMKVFDL
jgi:hypothetical protein